VLRRGACWKREPPARPIDRKHSWMGDACWSQISRFNRTDPILHTTLQREWEAGGRRP
jgi:hypothetical protein